MTKIAPMLSSKDQTWNTPRWFIDRLELALGPIGLDPCSNRYSVVRAVVEYDLERRGEDGLALPWSSMAGLVFVNPPFGRAIGEWIDRCATSKCEAVALVPARVDTLWWHRAYVSSSACVLWRGRFAFRLRASKTGNAPFPSSIFYWGHRPGVFTDAFASDGIVAKR